MSWIWAWIGPLLLLYLHTQPHLPCRMGHEHHLNPEGKQYTAMGLQKSKCDLLMLPSPYRFQCCTLLGLSVLLYVAVGGHTVGAIFGHFQFWGKTLPESFGHVPGASCMVDHSVSADILWLLIGLGCLCQTLNYMYIEQVNAFFKYVNLSLLVSLGLLWMALSNCSQKICQFNMLPWKVGTSIFGSWIPEIFVTSLFMWHYLLHGSSELLHFYVQVFQQSLQGHSFFYEFSGFSIYYINSRILCVRACVCVCNFWNSWERDVIAPCFLHHQGELCLSSRADCFSSWQVAWFEKKAFRTFSQVTCETTPFTLQWSNT